MNSRKYILGKHTELEFRELSYVRKDLPMEKELPKVMIQYTDTNTVQCHIEYHIHTDGKRAGWAHVLEHCMFGNVYQGKTLTELMDWLFSKGIQINANTGTNRIHFEFQCTCYDKRLVSQGKGLLWEFWKEQLPEKLQYDWKLFLQLMKNVLYHIPTEEDFERERKIVLSEITPDQKDTRWRNRFSNLVYQEQDLGPGGFVETVEKCTYEDIVAMSNILKDPSNIRNIQLIVPKNLHHHKIDDMLRVIGSISDYGYQEALTRRQRMVVKTCSAPLHLTDVKQLFPHTTLHSCQNNDCAPEEASRLKIALLLPTFSVPYTSDGDKIEEALLWNWTYVVTMDLITNRIHQFFRNQKEISYGVYWSMPSVIDHRNSNGEERCILQWDVLPGEPIGVYESVWKEFKRKEAAKRYTISAEELDEIFNKYFTFWALPIIEGKAEPESIQGELLYRTCGTLWRDFSTLDRMVRSNYQHVLAYRNDDKVKQSIQEMYKYILKNSPAVLVCQKD